MSKIADCWELRYLGMRVAEGAAAEADGASLSRADGEEEAVAEAVAIAAALTLHDDAGFYRRAGSTPRCCR